MEDAIKLPMSLAIAASNNEKKKELKKLETVAD